MAKEPAPAAAAAKPAANADAAPGAPSDSAKSGAAPKRSSLKVMLMVVMVLVLEGATIGLTIMFSGGPAKVIGEDFKVDHTAVDAKLVEIQVAKEKFANQRTGRTYLYDTEIYITVHARDEKEVKEKVEAMQAQLATEIGIIFRRAEPAHLLEPTLATLTRQIKGALDERVGKDAEGKPLVQETLVRKCIQLPVGL